METTSQTPEAAPEAASPPPESTSRPVANEPTFPPGTKLREYETVFLLKQELSEDAGDKFRERLRELTANNGGKVIKFSTWGRKKTQYEIEKQGRAVYVHMHYLAPAEYVAELERILRLSDEVIRFQTIKIADETDANTPVEEDVKLAGDVEQERPARDERSSRDDRGGERRQDARGGDAGEGSERGDRSSRDSDDEDDDDEDLDEDDS